MRDRGWNWRFGVPEMVGDFNGRFKNSPKRVKRTMILNFTISEQMILIIRDPLSAGERLTAISRALGYHNLSFTTKGGLSLLGKIMLNLFRMSDPLHSPQRGKPLGDLATSVVMYITGHEETKALKLLENPLLHAQGGIEQKYLDMSKKLKSSLYMTDPSD